MSKQRVKNITKEYEKQKSVPVLITNEKEPGKKSTKSVKPGTEDDEIIFPQKMFGGYDPRKVDEVIIKLQSQIAELKKKNIQMAGAYGKKFKEISVYLENMEKQRTKERLQIAETMTAARGEADRLIEKTNRDTEAYISSAKQKAKNIIGAACHEAQIAVTEAKQQSEQILASANREAENIRIQMDAEIAKTEKIYKKIAVGATHVRQHLVGLFLDAQHQAEDSLSSLRRGFSPKEKVLVQEGGDGEVRVSAGEKEKSDYEYQSDKYQSNKEGSNIDQSNKENTQKEDSL